MLFGRTKEKCTVTAGSYNFVCVCVCRRPHLRRVITLRPPFRIFFEDGKCQESSNMKINIINILLWLLLQLKKRKRKRKSNNKLDWQKVVVFFCSKSKPKQRQKQIKNKKKIQEKERDRKKRKRTINLLFIRMSLRRSISFFNNRTLSRS